MYKDFIKKILPKQQINMKKKLPHMIEESNMLLKLKANILFFLYLTFMNFHFFPVLFSLAKKL